MLDIPSSLPRAKLEVHTGNVCLRQVSERHLKIPHVFVLVVLLAKEKSLWLLGAYDLAVSLATEYVIS